MNRCLSAPNPPSLPLEQDPLSFLLSDGGFGALSTGALEGQWRPQQSKDSPLLVPMHHLQHNSQQVCGLGVPTSVALTDQPSPINFSTSWAPPMDQLRSKPSSECSEAQQASPAHQLQPISLPPGRLPPWATSSTTSPYHPDSSALQVGSPGLSLQFCPGSLPLGPRRSSCSVHLLLLYP